MIMRAQRSRRRQAVLLQLYMPSHLRTKPLSAPPGPRWPGPHLVNKHSDRVLLYSPSELVSELERTMVIPLWKAVCHGAPVWLSVGSPSRRDGRGVRIEDIPPDQLAVVRGDWVGVAQLVQQRAVEASWPSPG